MNNENSKTVWQLLKEVDAAKKLLEEVKQRHAKELGEAEFSLSKAQARWRKSQTGAAHSIV